jgi:predicted dithiol-disulfide oxidoreductase (DUF899 family)
MWMLPIGWRDSDDGRYMAGAVVNLNDGDRRRWCSGSTVGLVGTRRSHAEGAVPRETEEAVMTMPEVVSPERWQAARDELLVKEKAATRMLDDLAAQRRRLPMVAFPKTYVFEGPEGKASLIDLFDGRRQLVVYQMMDNGPDDYCSGCSGFTDSVGELAHLHARDTSYAVVSNMPLAQMTSWWKRMGWTVPYYSSRGTSFSEDCGTGEGFGLSVFLRDGRDGHEAYRTYFTTARGVDRLRFDFNILDLTPYGRQEEWEDSPQGWPQTPPYEWWRHHDEYENTGT